VGFVDKTPEGRYRAYFRDPAGKQRSKTFRTKRDATAFLAEVENSKSRGTYVFPHAGRLPFGEHARRWMATWNTEATTAAKHRSIMETHVLPWWGDVPLSSIDHLGLQEWITALSARQKPATVGLVLRLASAVLRSAVRNRLIAFNPAEDVRVPRIRRSDTDERIISRPDLRGRLLPEVPDRYRGVVATAAGAGLRWGEVVGLRADAIDLERARLSVIRTVTEVAGRISFKPFPKSAAGRRVVPLPAWLVPIIHEHRTRWPTGSDEPVFANEVRAPLRRTLFRSRIWRPSLVRAGLLGEVAPAGGGFEARWTDEAGIAQRAAPDLGSSRATRRPAPVGRAALPRPAPLLHDVARGRRSTAQHGAAGDGTRTLVDHTRPLHAPHRQQQPHPRRAQRPRRSTRRREPRRWPGARLRPGLNECSGNASATGPIMNEGLAGFSSRSL
jgi:integrase